MASIRITRYEVQNNLLPAVCVVTGEPTTDVKRHTFRWTPPWVGILILGGVLPYVIVAMILRKDITFDVPISAAISTGTAAETWTSRAFSPRTRSSRCPAEKPSRRTELSAATRKLMAELERHERAESLLLSELFAQG